MLSLLRHRFTRRIVCTLVFELLAIGFCFSVLPGLGWIVRLPVTPAETLAPTHPRVLVFAIAATLVIQLGFWSFGLYSRRVIYSGRRVLQNLLGSFLLLAALLLPISLLFGLRPAEPPAILSGAAFPEIVYAHILILAVFTLAIGASRYLVLRVFNTGTYLGNILILGGNGCCREVIQEARRHHGDAIRLVGILSGKREEIGRDLEDVPVVGVVDDLRSMVEAHDIKTILLSLPYDYPDLPLDYLLECRLAGMNVYDSSTFYESVGQKILLEKMDPFSVLFPSGYNMTRLKWFLKETSEKLLAFILLAIFAVPFLLACIAIRLTSAGPIVYRQQRVGKGGRSFTLLKFRTMVQDAEKATGAMWAQKNDPRTTAVGRLLRRTRFDELPQLINILRGDMAFVGPRPERPEFVENLVQTVPFYHHRHFVKPGLTGWAQVAFSYAASVDDSREKLRYDLYYIKNMSFFFDMIIVLATARAVVTGNGVR